LGLKIRSSSPNILACLHSATNAAAAAAAAVYKFHETEDSSLKLLETEDEGKALVTSGNYLPVGTA
jgi:hypothetical protein